MTCVIHHGMAVAIMATQTDCVSMMSPTHLVALHYEPCAQESEEDAAYEQLRKLERSRKPKDQLMARSLRETLRRKYG